MKAKRKNGGFTLVEMLVVVAIIGILAGLLLPALVKAKMKARRIQCVSDLKQAGVAFHVFMHDHDGMFPMQISTNNGGTLEYVYASYQIAGPFYFQYRHFLALSNELNTPKVVYCPTDRDRLVASNFHDFENVNVSYFVGANAEYNSPNSILAGDRNVTNGAASGQTIVRLGNGSGLFWTGELHEFQGDILYADGRVEELNNTGFNLASYGAPPVMDLETPSVKSSSGPPSPSGVSVYSPPPNLQPLPSSTTPPRRNTSAAPQSASTGTPSRPDFAPGTPHSSSSSRSSTAFTTRGDSGTGPTKSNTAKKAVTIRTNSVIVSNDPPPVLAEASTHPTHASNHWPWWFWVWMLLLLLAGEGTRRYYLHLRKEQSKRKW